MRSKKSKQIVTGILAVILIVTMLIGVVSPVFAAEDEKVGQRRCLKVKKVSMMGNCLIL